MTDFSSSPDDEYVVRVNAHVMTRDDSAGGWNAIKGGMAVVGLRKQLVVAHEADDPQHEYLIHGQRIKDQSEVLSCILTKDVDYTKANPTFIHWQMEGKKFGLTFTSSADAKAFDKGMTNAVDDILNVSRHDANANIRAGDDDVFMTLDLPLGRNGSSSLSASTTSTTTSSPSPQSPALPNINEAFHIQNGSNNVFPHPHANQHYLHKLHYVNSDRLPMKSPSQGSSEKSSSTKSNQSIIMSENEIWIRDKNSPYNEDFPDSSYVEFNTSPSPKSRHDYSYPNLDSGRGPPQRTSQRSPQRRDSISSMKRHMQSRESPNHPPLPLKHKKTHLFKKNEKKQTKHLLGRAQCKYCKEAFSRDVNPRGSCEDAPDCGRNCIEGVTCLCSARGLLFHCLADEEHSYDNPCLCDTSDENNSKKWTMLTLLSVFVPCLWCYVPLMACHKSGVSRGCCGGRHRAS